MMGFGKLGQSEFGSITVLVINMKFSRRLNGRCLKRNFEGKREISKETMNCSILLSIASRQVVNEKLIIS